ncbi:MULTISPECIES: hypothetical protein [Gammaproteobacteria]|uniref:hypothetical protein n=1 Tax=Gammaproteobacteria TaxID=1236 RepID=UPI000F815958|nr:MULTISPECIES: hypothetical protein [Gammaproteobacteria]RTE85872.1 hypothetical protein DQX04_10520 [Aliidiomarina sp. B3213]TCZ90127.1 hypothetical protein EYQ95_09940 [Lysobacter sp. N42]
MKYSLLSWIGAMLAVVVSASAQAQDTPRLYNLYMLGSELEICSSMKQEWCENTSWIQANEMRTARLFDLSDVRRRSATNQAIWPDNREDIRNAVSEALAQMSEHFGRGIVPEPRFVERFRSRAHLDLLMQLTDAEYNRILDTLELRRLEGLNEVANIEQSSPVTQEFITDIVNMMRPISGGSQPRLTLVTAAARNSFAQVQRYTSAFEQAGAIVQWLPLDSVVTKAQMMNACDELEDFRRTDLDTYDRDRVSPQFHAQQVAYCEADNAWRDVLATTHGVFFLDGRAQRLRDAMVQNNDPVGFLGGVLERFREGSLIVFSEGEASNAMVQSNMLSNGTSREAMRRRAQSRAAPPLNCDLDNSCPRNLGTNTVTYDPLGGLGIFPFGTVDSEFAQRGRQVRLMKLAQQAAIPLSFGIDRNTGLQVNTAQSYFRVQGNEGVTIFEGVQGNRQFTAATFHYLQNGATGRLTSTSVNDIVMLEQPTTAPRNVTNRFLDNTGVYASMTTLCQNGVAQLVEDIGQLIMQVSDDSQTQSSRGRCQVVNGTMGVALNDD